MPLPFSGSARACAFTGTGTLKSGVSTSVRLIELDETDLLAGLSGVANALIFKTDVLDEIAICQLSGGLEQTAYALLSDLVTLRRRREAKGDE